MGAIKAAICDGVVTFFWMFCVSTVGPLTALIAETLAVTNMLFVLGITVLLITTLLMIFNPICYLLGNASFNPANNAAFYAAGIGDDTLFSMALRFPAQALGAVGGVLAIREVMPLQYKSMLAGPALKVDVNTGAMAEGILTFLITFAVLWIFIKGPGNPLIKMLMISTTTVAMVIAGGTYTGPSMNPINAYGWAYLDNKHNTWEQFYVYWIPSFVGAIVAAWIFKFLFLQPAGQKAKKA